MHVTYFATVVDMSAKEVAHHAYMSVASTQHASETRLRDFCRAFARTHYDVHFTRRRLGAFKIPTNVLEPGVYRLISMKLPSQRRSAV